MNQQYPCLRSLGLSAFHRDAQPIKSAPCSHLELRRIPGRPVNLAVHRSSRIADRFQRHRVRSRIHSLKRRAQVDFGSARQQHRLLRLFFDSARSGHNVHLRTAEQPIQNPLEIEAAENTRLSSLTLRLGLRICAVRVLRNCFRDAGTRRHTLRTHLVENISVRCLGLRIHHLQRSPASEYTPPPDRAGESQRLPVRIPPIAINAQYESLRAGRQS